jgi:ethanolamine utilization protein EutN
LELFILGGKMNFAQVLGTVVATRKYETLKDIKFYIIQPLDEHKQPQGQEIIAADTVGARPGDLVLWVDKREAALALPDPFNPADAAVVGIVDHIGV